MNRMKTAVMKKKSTSDYDTIQVLSPRDVFKTLSIIEEDVTTTILDPWYNKGVGGVREDYQDWLNSVILKTAEFSEHIFVWGFPEIVYHVLDNLPENFSLIDCM